jgi:signal transduction histidine kinase
MLYCESNHAHEEEEMSGVEQIEGSLALENARLAQERRRVAALTTINQVARRVSASLDLQETLDTIVDAAAELVPCALAEISLWDETHQMLVLQALRCEPERTFPIGKAYPPGKGYTGWVVRNRQPLLVPDVDVREDIQPDILPGELPFKAYVGLPLLAGDELIGTLVLIQDQAPGFDEEDLRLLEGLADQASAAIRNARLFEQERTQRELAEALTEAAAAVGSTLDLDQVLDRILEQVERVVPGDVSDIVLIEGDNAHMVRWRGYERVQAEHLISTDPVLIEGDQYFVTMAEEKKPVFSPDTAADPKWLQVDGWEWARAYVGAPIIVKGLPVGFLDVYSTEPGRFGPSDARRLEVFAHHIAAAVANAQLFTETQHKAHELAALNAVAAAINQALDLETLLADAVGRVIQVVGADAGGIRLLDPKSNELSFVFNQGLSPEYAAIIHTARLGEGIAGRVVQDGEPVLIADMWERMRTHAPSHPHVREALLKEGLRARVEVPLCSRERTVGTLGVASRTPGAFGPADVDLLTAIGNQLGMAIENARLQQQALEAERLAAVGRVATSVAHDLRSPLGGIIRSADFLARPELSDSTRQKLSRAVVALARRLINTTQEILDYTRGGRMVLRLASCDLPEFLEQVIEVLRVDFSDRGIEVIEEWGYTGEVQMDPDRMAQVVYNIAANARDAMPEGGQLTIGTRRVNGWVELWFADTGPGVPPELCEHIFEPFVSHGKREGAGLGLAIARRIVQEHGGRIGIESPAGGGATFVVRLPLQE